MIKMENDIMKTWKTIIITAAAILGTTIVITDIPVFNQPNIVYADAKSQKEAVKKTKDYVKYDHASKANIIKQLVEWDDFSEEDAQYAVNHVKCNYKKAALETAKDYVNHNHMSKEAIQEQLTSEWDQFTEKEAQYAVKHLKADDKKTALKRAKDLYKNSHLSKECIYETLFSPDLRFSKEDAQYAVDHLDVDYKEAALAQAKEIQETDADFGDETIPDDVYSTLISAYYFTDEEAQYAIDHLND